MGSTNFMMDTHDKNKRAPLDRKERCNCKANNSVGELEKKCSQSEL